MNKTNVIRFIVCVLVAIAIKLFVYSGDNISDFKDGYRVETELEPYLRSFVDIAALKGLDLSYIYDQRITIVWEHAINKRSTNVATSFGRNKDAIIIVVNQERFMARTDEGRKYVMWHELGHDILNFKHLEGGDRGMMEPTAYTGFFKNYERFNKETQQNYLYKSLNKMFDRFINKGDGISDEDVWVFNQDGVILTLVNEETKEFFLLSRGSGGVYIGTFKGRAVKAFIFDSGLVVRDLITDDLVLEIKTGDGISDIEGKWDIGGFKMFGYRIISFTNYVTKEFYGFIGQRGYKLIGIWKGEIAYAIETDKKIEVRDFNDKLLLTIKK